jgi:hypothetical protein
MLESQLFGNAENTLSFGSSGTVVLPGMHLVPITDVLEVNIVEPSRSVDASKLDVVTHASNPHAAMCGTRMSPVWDLEFALVKIASMNWRGTQDSQCRCPSHAD